MNKMLTHTLIGAAVLALAAGGALAQQDDRFNPKKPRKPAVEDKAASGTAKDVKVKDKGQARNATVAATGDRAGPSACDIHIDNRTDWIIHRVYIDQRNWGSVGRFGDGIARDVSMGPTHLYAEADFTDGSKRYWGPRTVPCDPWSTFTWTLR